MGLLQKVVLKPCNVWCLLGVVLLFMTQSAYSNIKIKALPNETTPKEIVIENDSLFMSINLDWKLTVNSFKYKPRDIEFIQANHPMPLVGVENNWSLYNCGFGIKEVTIESGAAVSKVLIHAYSNYLENPFHVFIHLTVRNRAEIEANIWMENQLEKGFHDLYRETDHLVPTGIVPGIPWLPFLSPVPGGQRKILYPAKSGYILENISERLMDGYKPVYEWERPPDPGSIRLLFNGARAPMGDPLLPTIVEFPEINMGVFLYREKSDIDWRFENVKEALWPSQAKGIARGGKVNIFEGVLRVFEGDWHQGFYWFKNRFRNNFDFTNYKRPGNEKYRNMFLGCWSFIYNHNIYDPINNRFTIGEYLRKAKREFGGFDQFTFWHSYNRVGVDPRDQFDLLQDLPGGVEGVKAFMDTSHALGAKVYLPYNPWDKIRRRKSMYERQAKDLGDVGADGLFLDTMGGGDKSFRTEVNKYDPSAQFLSEFRPSLAGLQFTTAHYIESFRVWPLPTVDLLRFVLPEHKIYKIERLQRNRKNLIYNALFNATGYAVWDDVFGETNVQTWDEKIIIYRFTRTMHKFSRVLETNRSMPLIPSLHNRLFVNGFFADDMHLYTLLVPNREHISRFLDNRVIGGIFNVDLPDNWHMVDIWNKRPVEIRKSNGKKCVFLPQEMPDVAACIVAMPQRIQVTEADGQWKAFIADGAAGTLELLGVDITMREQSGPVVDAKASLVFDKDTAECSSDGYVLIQYRNEKKEVKDVALVKVGY